MLKILPILLILLFTNITAIGQTFTYTFVDPCTKEITQFNLPIQSGNGSLVSFLGQQKYLMDTQQYFVNGELMVHTVNFFTAMPYRSEYGSKES